MQFMQELLHAASVLHTLTGRRFGHPVHVYMQLGSTNDEAKQLAEGGAPEGLLVLAEEQTAGRGRLDRRWLTPPGTALAFSLVLRPTLAAHLALRVTMLVGVAVCKAIQQLTPVTPMLKWPNDILINGKKVGGILVEGGMEADQLQYAVVGIGLNVSAAPADGEVDFPATALQTEAQTPVDRLLLLSTILQQLEEHYALLTAPDDQLRTNWVSYLTWLRTPVVVQTPTGDILGEAQGVDTDGALLIQLPSGETVRVLAGDVRLRLA